MLLLSSLDFSSPFHPRLPFRPFPSPRGSGRSVTAEKKKFSLRRFLPRFQAQYAADFNFELTQLFVLLVCMHWRGRFCCMSCLFFSVPCLSSCRVASWASLPRSKPPRPNQKQSQAAADSKRALATSACKQSRGGHSQVHQAFEIWTKCDTLSCAILNAIMITLQHRLRVNEH